MEPPVDVPAAEAPPDVPTPVVAPLLEEPLPVDPAELPAELIEPELPPDDPPVLPDPLVEPDPPVPADAPWVPVLLTRLVPPPAVPEPAALPAVVLVAPGDPEHAIGPMSASPAAAHAPTHGRILTRIAIEPTARAYLPPYAAAISR